MNELTVMLATSRAREICQVLAGELSKSPESEMVAMLVAETLLKEVTQKIAAKDGLEAVQRRWLALQSDVTTFVLAQPRPAPRRLES